MLRFYCTLLLIFTALIAVDAQAKVTDRAKNRARQRTNQRVDQKVDQGVNQALDKVEGLFRRKKNRPTEDSGASEPNPVEGTEPQMDDMEEEPNTSPNDYLRGLQFGGEFEPYENPVKMNVSMEMVVTDKKGKTQTVNMEYTFDTWATGIKYTTDEDQVMRTLLDNKEGYMTLITYDKGEPTGVRMRQQTVMVDDLSVPEDDYTMTPTGESKMINGYLCYAYRIEHEDGVTIAWLTKDIEVAYTDVIRAMAAQGGQIKYQNDEQGFAYDGFPIQYTTTSANGKETVTATFKDFKTGSDVNFDIFKTDDIEIMNIGY